MTNQIALGPDFCQNIALAPLGFATTFRDLFTKAAAGTPDAGWDFDPDKLNIKEGTTLLVTDQGGEPHTFTEVKKLRSRLCTKPECGGREVSECVPAGLGMLV
jgi:plastocyanin